MIKLYVAIPTTGTQVDAQVSTLRRIEAKYKDRIQFIYPEFCTRRMFHDFARNSMVEDFLKSEADILWFLDSDVVPADHVLDLITEHGDKWKVAGAPYPLFMAPKGEREGLPECVLAVYDQNDTGGLSLSRRVPHSGTDSVAGLATGCLFIRRDVFQQLEKPYFEFKFDKETRNLTEGEDLGFCLKVKALGMKFFTDYSMVCKHYKNVDLLDVNNYAALYAQRALSAYQQQIEPQMRAAVQAAYQTGLLKGSAKPAQTLWTPSQKV